VKNKIINIFLWLFLIIEGLIFIFLLPPFQKYDETGHFSRAVALSSGQFFCKNSQFLIPKDLAKLPSEYNFTSVLIENKTFPIDSVNFNEKRGVDKGSLVAVTPCNFSFVGYLPNVLGLWMGGLTNNLAIIFYSGRIFAFIFFVTMLSVALKIIKPKFQYLLWFYALTPLVVHQVTSFSYDVMIMSLVPVLISLFINRLDGAKWLWRDWVIIWIIFTAVSCIKIVYLPLVLLFMVIDLKKIKINFLILILVSIVSLGITKILMKDMIYNQYVNPTIQQKLVLTDPVFFVSTLIKTISSNWQDEYKSMVAVFGWKNVTMSNDFGFYVYLLAIVWVINETGKKMSKKVNIGVVILGLTINLGIIFYIYLAMYLTWSVVASSYIYGTQGRYYLPLLPFVLILLSQLWVYIKDKGYLLVGGVMLLVLISSINGLYSRYFDYSKNFVDKPMVISKKDKVSFVLIDSKKTFDLAVTSNNISGFKVNIDNQNKAILIPYRYRVMDKSCKKTLKYGYFRQYDIQNDNNYIEIFGKIDAKDNQLCFEITPFTFDLNGYTDSFLSVKNINDRPSIEWIYF